MSSRWGSERQLPGLRLGHLVRADRGLRGTAPDGAGLAVELRPVPEAMHRFVDQHATGAPQADDMTLLILQRQA